jgi:hypothetical protein
MAELKEITNDPEAREESAKEVERYFREITRKDTTWLIKMTVGEICQAIRWWARKMYFKFINHQKKGQTLKQEEIDALFRGVKEK